MMPMDRSDAGVTLHIKSLCRSCVVEFLAYSKQTSAINVSVRTEAVNTCSTTPRRLIPACWTIGDGQLG